MRLVIFGTPELQATGLQYVDRIDPDALYIFPLVDEGQLFHSRNVREPFDLAFLSRDMTVLDLIRVFPERGTARAPKGTYMAAEAKAGSLAAFGFAPGRRVNF